MTKFIYRSKTDENLIGNSYLYMEKMIFGSKDNQEKTSIFRDMFSKAVKKVAIYPWGTDTDDLNSTATGICKYNDNDAIEIEMWGYTNAPTDKYKWIEHQGVHEFCHAFVDILSLTNSDKIVKKGIVRENHAGLIKETDQKTGEFVDHHYYGKMFNETMMDIISAMAINNFAPEITYKTVDDVLSENYTKTGNQQTGYTFFTSLTRLMIAAFSNVGDKNFKYQDKVDAGESIFNQNYKLRDGSVVKANDFLYGIVFDPLHIEKEFDKYMDDDSWRTFSQSLDTFFMHYQKTGELLPENVALIMEYIPDFCNKRMADYERRGAITIDESNNMASNFNEIWNSMQREYGAYFSQERINKISDRASKYRASKY